MFSPDHFELTLSTSIEQPLSVYSTQLLTPSYTNLLSITSPQIQDLGSPTSSFSSVDIASSPSENTANTKKKKKTSFGECKVCCQSAHGLHFGILTCRACAAFFRRTTVLNREYTCRKGPRNCNIGKNERFLCKLCRYNKCVELGMTPDNVQVGRDSIMSESKKDREKVQASETTENEPQLPSRSKLPPDPASTVSKDCINSMMDTIVVLPQAIPSEKPLFVVDLTEIRERLTEIFTKPISSSKSNDDGETESTLSVLEQAMFQSRRRQIRHPEIRKSFTIDEDLKPFCVWSISRQALWLMQCEAFAALPLDQKFKVMKNCWGILARLERYHMSVELFGSRVASELLVVLSDKLCCRLDDIFVDLSPITDYPWEDVQRMFRPFLYHNNESVAKPMLELAPSITELVYMLMQIVWHVEDTDVSSETVEVADRMRQKYSDELHHHYTVEVGMANYANRLMRLMSIVHSVKSLYQERNKMIELAKIFDVFKMEIRGSIFD